MVSRWADADEFSRRMRPSDAAPGRADIPAARWAECANRFGPPVARHVGRPAPDTARVPRAAYDELRERHAALVAAQDQSLADNAALVEERDAWRAKAADLDNRLGHAESSLREIAWGHLSWFVAGGALTAIVCTLLSVCIGRL